MKIYDIKTPKNSDGLWNKPKSVLIMNFHHSISEYRKQLSYAILTMLFETKRYPLYANFYEYKGDIQTTSCYYIFYYDKNILDDYTIYNINDDEERKNVERIIKLKKIL